MCVVLLTLTQSPTRVTWPSSDSGANLFNIFNICVFGCVASLDIRVLS